MFPLLASFLPSFPFPPSFFSPPFPPLTSLPTNYVASAAWRSDTVPWKCTCTESALISPRSSHVCIMIRMKNQIYGISFLLISFLLFNCMFSTSWAILVSVVWMFVPYYLPGDACSEYKYAKLLKMWLLKVAQKSDWKFIKNW